MITFWTRNTLSVHSCDADQSFHTGMHVRMYARIFKLDITSNSAAFFNENAGSFDLRVLSTAKRSGPRVQRSNIKQKQNN